MSRYSGDDTMHAPIMHDTLQTSSSVNRLSTEGNMPTGEVELGENTGVNIVVRKERNGESGETERQRESREQRLRD